MADPVHFEITHKAAEQLRSFYEEVFSWKINTIPGPVDYATVDAAEGGIAGGIGGVPDENYPGHVTFYVQVDDPAETLKKIEERGGNTDGPGPGAGWADDRSLQRSVRQHDRPGQGRHVVTGAIVTDDWGGDLRSWNSG